jgi:hypothetical protein
MLEERKVFHESWYRLSGQRLALRSSVKVRRQMYRGSRWYVLHDPFNNQFYRLAPPAYAFVARLGLERTLEEAWPRIRKKPRGRKRSSTSWPSSTTPTCCTTSCRRTAPGCSNATGSASRGPGRPRS